MKRRPLLLLIVIAVLFVASLALAQSVDLDLPWYKIAGGGGVSSDGARFSLSGAIGQAEAGQASAGATFALSGGYWSGVSSASVDQQVFLPLVVR